MNKKLIFAFLFISLICFGQQKTKIFVSYDKLEMMEDFHYSGAYEFREITGICFKSNEMMLIYNYNDEILYLDKDSANKIKTLSFKEIIIKQGELALEKYDRYVWGNKNSVFQTYVIQKLEDGSAKLYPVIWANQEFER